MPRPTKQSRDAGREEEELRSSGKISSSPPLLQKNHMPKREYRDLNVPKRKIRIFGQEVVLGLQALTAESPAAARYHGRDRMWGSANPTGACSFFSARPSSSVAGPTHSVGVPALDSVLLSFPPLSAKKPVKKKVSRVESQYPGALNRSRRKGGGPHVPS